MDQLLLLAAILGVVEGLTEFLPVSSTGHLVLLVDLLGFQGPPGKVFEVAIQLGAILAICWAYRAKLWAVVSGLPTRSDSRRFIAVIIAAFVPAAVIGYLLHDVIKSILFSPYVVSVSLIVGGFAILAVERNRPAPRVLLVEKIGMVTALKIGFCQSLAMVPGVSRAGATIMGAVLFRVDRAAATEFSFFLAIPTMLGATALDLYKNWSLLNLDDSLLIGTGFATAFLSALIVVRGLVSFVGQHGFVPFAWYRIVIGLGMLLLLWS